MDNPKAIKDWMDCVQEAKRKLGVPVDSFMVIDKTLLKEAQKCYCSKGY
jgi:hypothetical protein